MWPLERTAISIVPRAPYAAWATSIGGPPLTSDDLANYRSVYLVEDLPDPDADTLLRDHFAEIFDRELFAWHEDRATWPKRLTWEMFQEWFEVEVIENVVELDGSGPEEK